MSAPPENTIGAPCEEGADHEKPEAIASPGTKAESFKFDYPEPIDAEAELTPYERRQLEIKRAALRAVLGYDERSFREVARELNCTPAAISASYVGIIDGLRWSSLWRTAATRKANAEAARRQWQKKKASPS